MKPIITNTIVALAALLTASPAYSQYTFFIPEGSFAIEVSLENTGLKRLPIYRNAITSLAVVEQDIIGGTSAREGMSPFLFLASIGKREITSVLELGEVVAGQNAIRSGFVMDKDHQLYAGTMPDTSDRSGGHLLKINRSATGKLQVYDLGIPVAGEGIFSIVNDLDFKKLYGISYPSGYFFAYDIQSGKSKVYRNPAPKKGIVRSLNEQFSLAPEDFLSRALITDNQGLVYGSLPFGKIFYFDPGDESIHELGAELPEVWGRRSFGQVQCWLKTKNGRIFGGNRADGQLFELNPSTKQIRNIGKPIMMPGLTGLTEGADGKIYGIAGETPGYSHLFSFNEEEGFKDFGNPEFEMVAPGIEQGILWRGFQIGTISSSEKGDYIVMGEVESLSQLLVFPVNSKIP
jgi:hypothetical protein